MMQNVMHKVHLKLCMIFFDHVHVKEAYDADITYGTNNEYGFDYLRDNIEFDAENLRQREPCLCNHRRS